MSGIANGVAVVGMPQANENITGYPYGPDFNVVG